MNVYAEKRPANKSMLPASPAPRTSGDNASIHQFVDNRPAAIAQRNLQDVMNNSPRVQQLKSLGTMQFGKKRGAARKAKAARKNVAEGSAVRVTTFGQNWAVLSWRDHIKALGMKAAAGSGTPTDSGKILFDLTNGHQIVADMNGYWRHHDGTGYLDSAGAVNPANPVTHFWNSQGSKDSFA